MGGDQASIAGAAARVDLTPATMLPLSGFANRSGPAQGVADRLEANALALRDASGRTAVLMTFDALYVGPAVDAALRAVLRDEFAIRDEDIILLASHTHYAPALDPAKPRLGAADTEHIEWVIGQCRTMLRALLSEPMAPLRLSSGSAPWDGAVHRRRKWPLPFFGDNGRFGWQAPVMAPDPRVAIDRSVRCWKLETDGGEPVALLWSCACHPTGFPDPMLVSAEYPGSVRAHIRGAIGQALPVLFLQGFAGDIRQRSPERRSLPKRLLQTLRWGPSFCAFDRAGWAAWTGKLCGSVDAALQSASGNALTPLTGSIRSAAAKADLFDIIDGDNEAGPVECRRLCIGDAIDLHAVSAEPSFALTAQLPRHESVVTVGYLGDVFGYWPTDRQVQEGGYEGGGFLGIFGLDGHFRPNIDNVFKAMVHRLESDPS